LLLVISYFKYVISNFDVWYRESRFLAVLY